MKTILGVNYYDVHDLSKMLGVSEVWIRVYIKRGDLSATKIGRGYLSTEKDIRDYLESQKVSSLR